jgi:NAD(P)-dependent dehydrogenase (short-subunit alcohol dehydrogenase family)
MLMNKPMAQKVALITGGSQGIGRATAMAFSAQGASVVIASRRKKLGLQVVHEISQARGKASYYQANVSLDWQVGSR